MPPIVVLGSFGPSLLHFRLPLLRCIRDAGFEPIAMAPSLDPSTVRSLSEAGIAHHCVQLQRTGMNPAADLSTLWHLVRTFQRIRPVGVIAYTAKPIVYGLPAAALAGVPSRTALITGLGYAFIDGSGLRKRVARTALSTLYAGALRTATGVAFQNEDDEALFLDRKLLPPSTPRLITAGSGVDLQHFAPRPVPEGPPWKVLMVARLLAEKGVREFAEAARVVKCHVDAVEFHLVGPLDSNPSAIAKTEVEAWQREGLITWHGAQSDIRPFLNSCHMLVLPSYREGTPRTVLEAMATGRPVITTDVPGCRQTTVHEVTGLLVPPRCAGELADAICRLLADSQRLAMMGQQARQRAEACYDDNVVAEQITALALRSVK